MPVGYPCVSIANSATTEASGTSGCRERMRKVACDSGPVPGNGSLVKLGSSIKTSFVPSSIPSPDSIAGSTVTTEQAAQPPKLLFCRIYRNSPSFLTRSASSTPCSCVLVVVKSPELPVLLAAESAALSTLAGAASAVSDSADSTG